MVGYGVSLEVVRCQNRSFKIAHLNIIFTLIIFIFPVYFEQILGLKPVNKSDVSGFQPLNRFI